MIAEKVLNHVDVHRAGTNSNSSTPIQDSSECKSDEESFRLPRHPEKLELPLSLSEETRPEKELIRQAKRRSLPSRTASRRSKKLIQKYHNSKAKPAFKKYKPAEDFPDLKNNKTLLAKVLTPEMYGRLRDLITPCGATLDLAIQHGLDHNQSSGSGVLLGDVDSYEMLAPLLDSLLASAGFPCDYQQCVDTDISHLENPKLPAGSRCCIRVDRSIADVPFPILISRGKRRQLQKALRKACAETLIGKFSELEDMNEADLDQARFDFQMPEELFHSCRRDYPDGRGIFLGRDDEFSEDTDFSVWINEREHCSVVTNCSEGDLKAVFQLTFDMLHNMEDGLKKQNLDFAFDRHFGYLTSDPSYCGTGITISVEVSMPLLSRQTRFSRILRNLRVQCERISTDCVLISNKDRIGLSEAEVFANFAGSIDKLISLEESLAANKTIEVSKTIAVPLNEKAEVLRLRLSQFADNRESAGPAPLSVVVSGRVGMNNVINGIYVKCTEVFNSRPVWEKVSVHRSVFLRWHSSGLWILDDEFDDVLKGFAFAKTDSLYPFNKDMKWHVYQYQSFLEDPEICVCQHGRGNRYKDNGARIKSCNKRIHDFPHKSQINFPELRSLSMPDAYRLVRSRSEESVACAAPKTIVISGESPCSFFINGTYTKADSLHSGKAFWRKSDGSYSTVIRWHEKGLWIVSDFLSTKKKGFALVQDHFAQDPSKVKRTWKAMSKGKYLKNPNISVSAPKQTEMGGAEIAI